MSMIGGIHAIKDIIFRVYNEVKMKNILLQYIMEHTYKKALSVRYCETLVYH